MAKVKVWLSREEYWPVYEVTTDPHEPYDKQVEVDEELLKRYQAALKEFKEAWYLMRDVYGEQHDD